MSSRRRQRRGSKGSSSYFTARVLLVVIFVLYRAVDLLTYFSYQYTEDRFASLGPIVGFGLWTTVLLVGMWYRQAWARWLLAGYLLLMLIFPVFIMLDYLKARVIPHPMVIIPFTVNLLTLLAILFLPPIKSLTRHRYPNPLDRR